MFNSKNKLTVLFITLLMSKNVSAMEVSSLGELCFRIRDPNLGNSVQRLMKLEVYQSGTRNLQLLGVVKNQQNNDRFWVSGSSHQLSGAIPQGASHWYSGQIHGDKDITNNKALVAIPYHASFTHPLPFEASSSQFRDTIANSGIYTMELTSCADLDFQNLYDAGFPQ